MIFKNRINITNIHYIKTKFINYLIKMIINYLKHIQITPLKKI